MSRSIVGTGRGAGNDAGSGSSHLMPAVLSRAPRSYSTHLDVRKRFRGRHEKRKASVMTTAEDKRVTEVQGPVLVPVRLLEERQQSA